MPWPPSRLPLGFQAKVLLPVLAIMVLLLAMTMWLVNHRITGQLQTEAAQRLLTTDAVFKNSQSIRARNLLLRYRNVPNEPRFKAVFQLGDPKTLRVLLADLVEEQRSDVVQFTTEQGRTLACVARDPHHNAAGFETRSAVSVKQALDGQSNVDTLRVGERLFEVVSIPVRIGENVVGALTFGAELGEAVAQEFKQLTHSEIVFMAGGRLAVSTIPNAEVLGPLAISRNEPSPAPRKAGRAGEIRKLTLNGEHFLALAGRFDSLGGDSESGYLLLSSYEQPLRVLRSTQHALMAAGLFGILFSGVIVWLLVRTVTRPLRELRDSAEAVGRGDFSHHVPVASRDECGELARVFNRMTDNLKISREQLEKTVETLKTTQSQLVQSEKLSAIGEFVAGVTHELNNPLTSVIGFAELLQQSGVNERHRRFLDAIVNAAQRCHKIVQSLLSFARQHQPERKLVNVHELVEAAVSILQYQMRTSNIHVTTQFDPRLPRVTADPHQIQQVFLNIINNARQAIEGFRPKGGIRITTDTDGERVRVTIQDDGPGISEENLAKIFNPFFTTKEVGKGTGLGLSLSYGILQEHGGSIIVRSKPGEGAAFIIELPVAAGAGETASAATAPAVATPLDGRGKRVLVVDDEDSILDLVREALTVNGYQMDVARDGETALQHLRQTRYDLTVCDWKMPGLSGQQVYERLRTADPRAAARLIFMTGDVVNEQTRKFLETTGNVCLSKPFSLDDFRSAVGKVAKAA